MAEFDGIKVGDKVVVQPSSFSKKFWRIEEVNHVTKTQFATESYRFTKRGHQVGGLKYGGAIAFAVTPERLNRVAQEQQRHQLERAVLQCITSIRDDFSFIRDGRPGTDFTTLLDKAIPHLAAAAKVLRTARTMKP